MSDLVLRVLGTPIPQGSKTAGVSMRGNRPHAYLRDDNPKLKAWRHDVTVATRNATGSIVGWQPLDGPLLANVTFWFTRPDSHYGTGRNAHLLKPSAPRWVSVIPDIDKLQRALFDGMADGGAFVNDSRIVRVVAEQLYAGHGQPPGADIILTRLDHLVAQPEQPLHAGGDSPTLFNP